MRPQPSISAPPRTTIRVSRWAYPLVTVASLLLGITSVVRGTRALTSITDSDLTNFFFKSADYILRGDPWHIYAVRGSGLTSTYPNFNPPLSIFLMAPLLRLAHLVGFAANYGEQVAFVTLPFLVFVPLLGYLVVRLLRFLYPEIPETQRLLAYMLVTLSPLTWQTYGTWYHVEQPLMLCFLVAAVLALQQRREGLGGVFAALAVLSRTTAIMPLVAVGVVLLAMGAWRPLVKFAVPAVALVVVAMAPFFIFAPADTKYSLLSWRGSAPIGGNSIWTIFAYDGTSSSLRHLIDAAARRLDEYSVLLVIVVAAFLAVRRLGITAYSRDLWAVLSIAMLAVPMLSKTNWPYYYLEPFLGLVIWEFATMHDRYAGVWRWPVLSLSFLCVAATLSQYIGLQSVGALDRVSVGVLEFGAMLAFVVATWKRAQAKKPVAAAASTADAASEGASGIGPAPATPLPARFASQAPQDLGALPNTFSAPRSPSSPSPAAHTPTREQGAQPQPGYAGTWQPGSERQPLWPAPETPRVPGPQR